MFILQPIQYRDYIQTGGIAAFKEDIPACSICKEIRCNAFPELHIFLNFVPFAFNFIFKAGFFILSTSLNDSWGYGCNTLNI